MLTLESFESYLGWRYHKQVSQPPYFKFYFKTKGFKLVTLLIPDTDFRSMIIGSVDLPIFNGEIILSDNGLKILYMSPL